MQWSLQNSGSLKAVGYKCDTAYMSLDIQWDIMDRQVGNTVCDIIELEPYEHDQAILTYTLNHNIPLLIPSEYYGLVRTRSNIKDPDLSNNVAATANLQLIDLPSLTLDELESGIILEVGQSKAYVIHDVPSDETLLVLLTSPDENSLSDLYVRYNELATAYQFDGFSQLTEFAKQEVVIENTYEGSYYVLVTNNGQVQSTVNILAKLAVFEVRRASPPTISNRGHVTLFIEGTLFERNMQAKLFTNFQETTATDLYYISSTRVYATFDMRSIIPGPQLSVQLTNIDSGGSTTLADSVRLIYGKRGSLTFSADSLRALTTRAVVPFQLNYINTGIELFVILSTESFDILGDL